MEDWCNEFIAHNKVNVELRGVVPNSEARKLIANSRALILPTQLYEGFPMSIVEAFSVGTPVICSDIGNAGNVVEEGVTGYKFAPDSPKSIVEAVIRCNCLVDDISTEFEGKYQAEQNYGILTSIYEEIGNQRKYA